MKKIITLFAFMCAFVVGKTQFLDCSAYFSYSVYGTDVFFAPMYGDSTNTATTYTWDFGDGEVSTEIFPMHDYALPGEYTVCLNATNNDILCDEYFCMTVEICAYYAEITSTQVDDNTWHFENTGYDGDNQSWSIIPGYSQYTGDSFDHDFIMSGTYTISQSMTTNQYYTFYSVNWWDGTITTSEYLCGQQAYENVEIDISNGTTISGKAFMDSNGDGILNEGELLTYVSLVIMSGDQMFIFSSDENGYYEAELAAGEYTIMAMPNFSGFVSTIPTELFELDSWYYPGYEITIGENAIVEGLNFGFISTDITVSGQVFADDNGNGVKDLDESGVPYAQITGALWWNSWSDSDGNYYMILPQGDYELSTEFTGSYTVPAGGTYSISNPDPGQNFSGYDFGLDVSGTDIACSIPWVTASVPGFWSWVEVNAINNGVAQDNVTLTLSLDDDLEFTSASDGGVYDSGTHSVTWTFDLGVLEVYPLWVDVYVPVDVEVETSIVYSAIISSAETDEVPENNVCYNQTQVVSSYDPNMIEVSPAGQTAFGNIPANLEMQYTIHFQNTGNYYATNVILHNELPTELDASSLEVIASSHPCTAQLDGSHAQFTFSGIMLPWESEDEAGSQGWVTYTIDQQPNLAIGTEIENTAEIYFDFNEAIITNTALNTITEIISVFETTQDVELVVFPNPADEIATVSWNGGNENVQFELLNMLGEKVLVGNSTSNRIEIARGDLAAGYYQLKFTSANLQSATAPIVFR